ncbi:hypothetical protein DIE14_35050 [Burkholderia sp. Bp9017]|uniref:hypothetical protein n=1 Tax=Burkholderia TaxID=32008 RepID=UPI000F5F202B|nr:MULTISPECIES: hypothetical protein [Burkholderia]MBY4870704.1 hypothetical protein [Burkholderia anthina]RQZ13566.1 hypothetical protein DIE14_35050 [Burkholderia sp. Bp9017]RQZ26228.1 hypothetical protein DIE13_30990 [Burkholderia sp. Bp9016]
MMTSTGVAACILSRGQFDSGELVKVSLDRPKYSREMWMLRAELDEHAAEFVFVDNVAHVKAFPKIAALERLRAYVCSVCLDELLVRSGEAPYRPTTKERAFDASVVAANAKWPSNHARCERHGLILPTRTSPDIEAAILSMDVVRDCRVVQVIDGSMKHEPKHWFDEVFLRKVFGPEIDLVEPTFRIDDRATFVKLWDAGERVCPVCLLDVLKRSGVTNDNVPA